MLAYAASSLGIVGDQNEREVGSGDSSFTLAKARFLAAWIANREIEASVPKLLEKYNIQSPPNSDWDDIVPISLKALLEESDSIAEQQQALDLARKYLKEQERDECQALEEAIPDLKRLQRYERRVWSQHKEAIRNFMNIRLMRDLQMRKSGARAASPGRF